MKNESNAVETAQTSADSVKAKIAEIKSKLDNPELTQEDFRKFKAEMREAEDDLELIELRERAATERAARQAEANRRENLLNLQSDLSKLSDTSDLDKLAGKVGDALDKFLSAAKVHQTKFSEIGEAISAGGFQPGSNVGTIEDLPAIVERGLTKIGSVEVEPFHIKSKLDGVIREVTQEHFPRGLY